MMAKYKNVCWLARGIPAGVVAGGVPCKVIRPITEADQVSGLRFRSTCAQ